MNNQHNLSTSKLIAYLALAFVVGGIVTFALINLRGKGLESGASESPRVRFVYMVPADMQFNPTYNSAIETAARTLQTWYAGQLGGRLFRYTVEHYITPNPAAYYSGSCDQWGYYTRTLEDGFAATGGYFNDPNNRWIFLNSADLCPNQGAGGTSGVAVLHGDDVRGLASNTPNRYIGGLGHELGHAFNLPHPTGCPQTGNCTQPLMYLGYTIFPANASGPVILTDADKRTLLESPLVAQFFLTNSIPIDPTRARDREKDPRRYIPVKEDLESTLPKPQPNKQSTTSISPAVEVPTKK